MSDEDYDMLDRMSRAINAAMVAEQERRELLDDRDYWKKQYQELLGSSLKEAQETTGMLLSAVLAGVVVGRKQ
jgi:hypothetical protein